MDLNNLYYLRARYYDPITGRFTQMDPFPGITTLPDTLNPYLYSLNNPVNYIDPSGKFVFLAIFAAGLLGGFIGGVGYYSILSLLHKTCWNPSEAMIWGAGGAILGAILASIGYGTWWIGMKIGWWGAAAGGALAANEVSNLTESDLPAVEQFVQDAKQINEIERGYGTFGNLWSQLAKSAIDSGTTANMFINRVCDKITGMMKVYASDSYYQIKYLEGIGNGAGTNLFEQAIRDSMARGFGGSIYLFPSEMAEEWYLTHFPGAQQLANGALYWTSEAAKAILGMK